MLDNKKRFFDYSGIQAVLFESQFLFKDDDIEFEFKKTEIIFWMFEEIKRLKEKNR